MKCLRRCFLVLLSCALLLTAYSLPVSAKEEQTYTFGLGYNDSFGTSVLTLNSGEGKSISYRWGGVPHANTTLHPYITVATADGTAIAKAGKEVDFTLNNIQFELYAVETADSNSTLTIYMAKYDTMELQCHYEDGTIGYFNDITLVNDNSTHLNTFTAKFTPTKDVRSIKLDLTYNLVNRQGTGVYGYRFDTVFASALRIGATVDVETEEEGLLSGIIGWVQNIFNSLTNGFTNLGNGISNVFNSIAELPGKLWTAISDGLKNLFIPSNQFILDFRDDMDSMLSEKFGAVYQVIEILHESWDGIENADETNSIDIPSTTINLPQNTKFSFGGYTVPIVPQGFEFIVDIVKIIVGIVCTILFVNGMRKRYDEVMGVEQ